MAALKREPFQDLLWPAFVPEISWIKSWNVVNEEFVYRSLRVIPTTLFPECSERSVDCRMQKPPLSFFSFSTSGPPKFNETSVRNVSHTLTSNLEMERLYIREPEQEDTRIGIMPRVDTFSSSAPSFSSSRTDSSLITKRWELGLVVILEGWAGYYRSSVAEKIHCIRDFWKRFNDLDSTPPAIVGPVSLIRDALCVLEEYNQTVQEDFSRWILWGSLPAATEVISLRPHSSLEGIW